MLNWPATCGSSPGLTTSVEGPPMQEAGSASPTGKRRRKYVAASADPFVLFGDRDDAAPGARVANDAQTKILPTLPPRRFRLDPTAPQALLRATDWLIALAAVEAAAEWSADASLLALPIGQAWSYLAVALALKAGLWLTESYRPPRARMRFDLSFGGLALGAILGLVIAATLAPSAAAASALAIAAPAAAIVMAGVHAAFAVWGSLLHRRGVFAETIAIVGATEAAEQLIAHAARTGAMHVAAVFDDRQGRAGPVAVAGGINDLLTWDSLPLVDRIVVAIPDTGSASVRAVLLRLRSAPNRIDLLMDDLGGRLRGPGLLRMPGGYAARTVGPASNRRVTAMKRAADIVLSAALLLALSPLIGLIALVTWMENKGPLLRGAAHIGANNHPFDALGVNTCDQAGRPTLVGRMLTRARLDGLPRLVNVLRGEMSLVGPRPHPQGVLICGLAPRELVADYAHRHRVRPGLTGWAQVNCARDGLSSSAALQRHTLLDLEYASRPSLWLDIVIVVRTMASALVRTIH